MAHSWTDILLARLQTVREAIAVWSGILCPIIKIIRVN